MSDPALPPFTLLVPCPSPRCREELRLSRRQARGEHESFCPGAECDYHAKLDWWTFLRVLDTPHAGRKVVKNRGA